MLNCYNNALNRGMELLLNWVITFMVVLFDLRGGNYDPQRHASCRTGAHENCERTVGAVYVTGGVTENHFTGRGQLLMHPHHELRDQNCHKPTFCRFTGNLITWSLGFGLQDGFHHREIVNSSMLPCDPSLAQMLHSL